MKPANSTTLCMEENVGGISYLIPIPVRIEDNSLVGKPGDFMWLPARRTSLSRYGQFRLTKTDALPYLSQLSIEADKRGVVFPVIQKPTYRIPEV